MSTPTLRPDEIAMAARPHAWCVTTARKMPEQRHHYPDGALVIWRATVDGCREPVRLVVHTMCQNWITLPVLVDGDAGGPICDLCMVHDRRAWSARQTPGEVDW